MGLLCFQKNVNVLPKKAVFSIFHFFIFWIPFWFPNHELGWVWFKKYWKFHTISTLPSLYSEQLKFDSSSFHEWNALYPLHYRSSEFFEKIYFLWTFFWTLMKCKGMVDKQILFCVSYFLYLIFILKNLNVTKCL